MNTLRMYLLFAGGLILVIAGAFLKISHLPGADTVLAIGLITGLLFSVLALWQIFSAPLPITEKTMWLIAFLFLNWVAAMVYIIYGQKRVERFRKTAVDHS